MTNDQKTKELVLTTGHSSWWKNKKYRRESSEILNKYRKQGWRLIKKKDLKNNNETIDTRFFKKYFLLK